MEEQYNPQKIEETTQTLWDQQKCFEVSEHSSKEKFFCLCMFPYPSGYLHVGHVRNYTIGDVITRYQRLLGKNVLQTMGWDAFGLPAENAAIKHKIPPAAWTDKNIAYAKKQFKRFGLAYDWRRELTTCDPNYYRWEQWFFLKLYQKGLVYKKSAEVNWDPVDQTILANEQVIDGRGWRSGALVERREIPQWFFKITAYADELLSSLDQLPGWPDKIKTMQTNWIGRSEGADILFSVADQNTPLTVYTTRADTLFGVTYLAIAPQHPLAKIAAATNPALQAFIEECRNIKVAEAELATLEKKGVFTGLYAIHPLTQARLPIWAANFVVMNYGTGALMAVPAHDQRDYEFAMTYHLPITQVIEPDNSAPWDKTQGAYMGPGKLIHSQQFSGLESKTATHKIIETLENANQGRRKINYRLRDWSVSRQRYWGTPVPIINCKDCGAVPVPENQLPVVLPTTVEFTGVQSPLKTLSAFYETTCPTCGKKATRETETFDTFFESSWYYARFACYDQDKVMLDPRVDYWVPVDQYIGGAEHAVMHLLYARFIHKALRDEGLLNSNEPFTRLLNQGMVLNKGNKMSKSKGNTVDPQPLIDQYGADTLRLFIIFASPPEQNLEWSDSGVEGAHRFLKKIWAFCYEQKTKILNSNQSTPLTDNAVDWQQFNTTDRELMRQIHLIMDQVKFDYDRLQHNTVVSSAMKILNLLTATPHDLHPRILQISISYLLRILSPITPHITHALWQSLGYPGLIIDASWPTIDVGALKAERIDMVIQINGKLRSRIQVPLDANQALIEKTALEDSKIQNSIAGKTVKKIVIVPTKLVNIVVGEA